MKPLRVAVALEQCWHRVPGGVALSAIRTARAIQELADIQQIGVAARHGGPPEADFRPLLPVRHLRLPRPLLYEAWHRARRPRVEQATGTVDVIHATGYAVPPRSAPLVVTMHDLAFVHRPTHFTRRGISFLMRSLELTRREADLVLCPSDHTRDDLEAHGFEPSRIRVVPWGVDQTRASPGDVQRVRQAWGLPDRYVLWTGTAEPRKNLATLVDAFGLLDRADVQLVLAGPVGWKQGLPSAGRETVGRVRRLGFVPGLDLAGLYAGADVFCYPSLLEGFGLPVAEAMVQGTAVVTSVGSPMASLVADAGFAVVPDDAAALAGALADALDDVADGGGLGLRAAARASRLTWDRTAAGVAAVYRELVA